MNDFYLVVDPTACTAHTSPQYEHHWQTTGWLCFIRSWAGSWQRLWTCPVCVLLTKGLWAAPDRIVNDLCYVVEMTAGFVCALTSCASCAICVCDYWLPFDMIADTAYTLPHSDYYRRAHCDRYLIRNWDGRWPCLCDCPYWLSCASDLWRTSDYYLSWQLTLLVCINVLIVTDRWFAPRGVDKYAVSGAWACCAFTCSEGES